MSTGRPEVLYPLFSDVTGLSGVGERTAKHFERIGITRVADLLMSLPTGVQDRRLRETLSGVAAGDAVTIVATVREHRTPRTSAQPYRIIMEGGGTIFELVYFRTRSEWVQKTLPMGSEKLISGAADIYDGRLQIAHPDLVADPADAATLPPWEPVYPLTQGLTQRVVARAARDALGSAPLLPEWVSAQVISTRSWPGWDTALRLAHSPAGKEAVAPSDPARQRLAYDELLSHQLALQLMRAHLRDASGRVNRGDGHLCARAMAAFGHPPTGAQVRAIDEIAADMAAPVRMMRLLQGDVGAGKTLVALRAMLTAVEAGGQATMMAPTEILARQHAAGLQRLADAAGVELVLLTGRDSGSMRTAKLLQIREGTAQLVIGTHALFQADVHFRDLRLVVVDEQHRFGVRQRMELMAKAPPGVDLLIMTATPIPRTLALAGYGDLDISELDEKPPGRQPIETALVSMERYDQVVERLAAALASGQRAYWVCPLVEESDVSTLVAAEQRCKALSDALGVENVRLIHGQMLPGEKDSAMADFQAGRAKVLVATTVIEVGVDVPEATIMVVEHAEHFGLAQLHQLRGRVGRGSEKSFCLLLYRAPLSETARARMAIMRETEDGFRIAAEDLRIRGSGDMLGTAQSGLPRFRLADLSRDVALLALARDEARLMLDRDPRLEGEQGTAARILLYLFERDESVRFLRTG